MKTATEIFVRVSNCRVVCPNCGADVDGWCGDPRGVETTCDECDELFLVHADADVELG